MRMDRQGWAAVEAASRAVCERALTEREACIEVWARTGGEPRDVLRAIRAGVRALEARGERRPPRSRRVARDRGSAAAPTRC